MLVAEVFQEITTQSQFSLSRDIIVELHPEQQELLPQQTFEISIKLFFSKPEVIQTIKHLPRFFIKIYTIQHPSTWIYYEIINKLNNP
ncbi:MAG: hypothetical protein ACTSYD_13545 [Candidatus Heimdallarchaeaceae archaeon]